ncbi:autotransporter strand-loop-strand O-heptosyltransferase, partial [Burkholderia pseudomallei]
LLPDGDWTDRLSDMHTDTPLFDAHICAGHVTSTRRHVVPFQIEIDSGENRVFKHQFDAHRKPLHMQFEAGRLGEALGWSG